MRQAKEQTVIDELALLRTLGLQKINDQVYEATAYPINVTRENIFDLVRFARGRGTPRFRICLHNSMNDAVQEMIMVILNFGETPIHRTIRSEGQNCTTSYHIIYGSCIVQQHDHRLKVTRSFHLSSDAKKHSMAIRLDGRVWRSMKTTSDTCIFLETATGPFCKESTEWSK